MIVRKFSRNIIIFMMLFDVGKEAQYVSQCVQFVLNIPYVIVLKTCYKMVWLLLKFSWASCCQNLKLTNLLSS